jgi:hypothetical protein
MKSINIINKQDNITFDHIKKEYTYINMKR